MSTPGGRADGRCAQARALPGACARDVRRFRGAPAISASAGQW
ncbi:hypothetical protein C7S16_4512 [Burkholderia thailandensis]|uniref:Uncharacterized protein n=1 Tax=Burkholderia thailandensis TaxID=57975 RepID=A0AAW9CMB6_BURTH|nr:hypothetical protein [Burkholderia thailandensis]MDW9252008.1 hypothetical protein [Burkholderia thailandensis]